MPEPIPLALTREQVHAFAMGQTIVYCEDPVTKRRYRLIYDEPQRLTLEEIRAMIQEGIDSLDRGERIEWNVEDIKARLRETLGPKEE